MPIRIFCCYAHEDEVLLNKLKSHLRPLQRQGLIDVWHDRDIRAGAEWESEISQHLNLAQIILLLVSSDFVDSDYCYGIEMKRAVERHERGEARVIPVILRPVYWQKAPFGKLQALPTDAKPVTSSTGHSQDEAFFDVAEGIRKVVEELSSGLKGTKIPALANKHLVKKAPPEWGAFSFELWFSQDGTSYTERHIDSNGQPYSGTASVVSNGIRLQSPNSPYYTVISGNKGVEYLNNSPTGVVYELHWG